MNLSYLLAYLETVKTGSLTKAARKLFISQPGISFQIRKLEEEIGLPLLEYHNKKMHMTEAGKRLFRFGEYVYHEYGALQHDLQQLRQQNVGNLFIISSPVPIEFILPNILGEFKEQFPGIGLNVSLDYTNNVMREIQNGTYKVGFCALKPDDLALSHFKLAEDEVVLIVYPAHPFSNRREVSWEDLSGESFILREESHEKQRGPADLLAAAGFDLSLSRAKLILGTNVGVIKAVEAGAGIAFTSSLAIQESEALGKVKAVRITGATLKREFFCIYRKEAMDSNISREFINFVKMKAQTPKS